ncbi:UNVERIFIED_CONTAM: hypothetical protein ABID98_005783 [Brevibacillus sp. OAP136]
MKIELTVRPGSYEQIKAFQKLLTSRSIYNLAKHENSNLIFEIEENDQDEVIRLAIQNRIEFY